MSLYLKNLLSNNNYDDDSDNKDDIDNDIMNNTNLNYITNDNNCKKRKLK